MFLVPYAVLHARMGGYDTGFSIANTTSGKTAQSGIVTFSFPGDATLEAFESDMVGPGQNLTMLLSEILDSGASYSGQVKIIANWTDAEGVAFISNFLTFTSASPLINLGMMVTRESNPIRGVVAFPGDSRCSLQLRF